MFASRFFGLFSTALFLLFPGFSDGLFTVFFFRVTYEHDTVRGEDFEEPVKTFSICVFCLASRPLTQIEGSL